MTDLGIRDEDNLRELTDTDDWWKSAVKLFTGVAVPDRTTVFQEWIGNHGIPLMLVELTKQKSVTYVDFDDLDWRTENMGNKIPKTDFVIPFYTRGGDDGEGSEVAYYKARITLLISSSSDPSEGGVRTGVEVKSKYKERLGLTNEDLIWDNKNFTKYSYAGGLAMEAVLNYDDDPATDDGSYDFHWDGVTVSSDAAVVLRTFDGVADSFDRLARFFKRSADQTAAWEKWIGAEDNTAWQGTAAGVFQNLIHKVNRVYEGYAEDTVRHAGGSIQGEKIREARRALRFAIADLYVAWDSWQRNHSNPLRWLVDRLLDIAEHVWDHNITKINYTSDTVSDGDGGFTTTRDYYTKIGFSQNAELPGTSYDFGRLDSLDTWKKIGEFAVQSWQASIIERLGEPAKDALTAVHNAWSPQTFDLGEIRTRTTGDTLKADWQEDQAKKDQAEAEAQAKADRDAAAKAAAEAEARYQADKDAAAAAAAAAEERYKRDKEEAEAAAKAAAEKYEREKAEAEAEAAAKEAAAEAKYEQEKAEQEAEQARQEAAAEARYQQEKADQEAAEAEAEERYQQEQAEQDAEQAEQEAAAEARYQQEKADQEAAEAEQAAQYAQEQAKQEAAEAEQADRYEQEQAEQEAEQDAQQAKQEAAQAEATAQQEAYQQQQMVIQQQQMRQQREDEERARKEAAAQQAEEEARYEREQAEQKAEQAAQEAKQEAKEAEQETKQEQEQAEQKSEQAAQEAKQEAKEAAQEAKQEARYQEEKAEQQALQEEQKAEQARQEAEQKAEQTRLEAKQDAQQAAAEEKQEQQQAEEKAEQARQEARQDAKEAEAQARSDQQRAEEKAEQQAEQARQEARQDAATQQAEERYQQEKAEQQAAEAEQQARYDQEQAEQKAEAARQEAKQDTIRTEQEAREDEYRQQQLQAQENYQSSYESSLNDPANSLVNGPVNGSGSLTNPDGSTSYVDSQGRVITDFSDGTKTIVDPDLQTSTVISPDGRSTSGPLNADDLLDNPDGSRTYVDSQGQVVTAYPDGSKATVDPDSGVTTVTQPDGSSTTGYLNNGGSGSQYQDTGSQLPSYEEELYDGGNYGDSASDYLAGNSAATAAQQQQSQTPMGGMPLNGQMSPRGGSGGGGEGSGERVRNVIDSDGAISNRSRSSASRSTNGGFDEREATVSTAGGTPFMPPMGGAGSGGPGQTQTESGDRVRDAWVQEDEDVWGTDEGGAPAVIGR